MVVIDFAEVKIKRFFICEHDRLIKLNKIIVLYNSKILLKHKPHGSGDLLVIISQVTLFDHVIKGSLDFSQQSINAGGHISYCKVWQTNFTIDSDWLLLKKCIRLYKISQICYKKHQVLQNVTIINTKYDKKPTNPRKHEKLTLKRMWWYINNRETDRLIDR